MLKHKTLVLIDGNNKVFTSEWGTGLYWQGKRTSGIMTFLMMLRRYANKYGRKNIIICWDSRDEKKRELYPEYKANRKRNPYYFEVKSEIKTLESLMPIFGIRQIKVDGYEADALIGDLHSNYKGKKVIVSTDSDLLQLINDDTVVHKGKDVINLKGLKQRTGLSPKKILLRKVIVGDTSDNIKGIGKIGDKTFFKILNETGSVKDFLNDPRIKIHRDVIKRNYKLIRLGMIGLKETEDVLNQNHLKMNINQVRGQLYKLGMFSIMKGFGEWISPFRSENE